MPETNTASITPDHPSVIHPSVIAPAKLQLGVVIAVLFAAGWMATTGNQPPSSETQLTDTDPSAPLKICLNTADRRELMLLPGIGKKMADRLTRHRDTAGPFHSLADLQSIGGIGPKMIASLEPWVTVTAPPTSQHVARSDNVLGDSFDDAWPGGHDDANDPEGDVSQSPLSNPAF